MHNKKNICFCFFVCVCFFPFFIKIQSGLELGYILSRAPVAQWYYHRSSPSWISLYFFQCHIPREFSYSSVFPSQKSPVVFPLVCNGTLPAHIVLPAVVLRRVTHQATKQYTDYSTTSTQFNRNKSCSCRLDTRVVGMFCHSTVCLAIVHQLTTTGLCGTCCIAQPSTSLRPPSSPAATRLMFLDL